MAFMHSNWRHWYFSNVKNTPFLHVKFYLQIYKEWVTNSTLLVVQAVAEMFWRWKLILPLGIWRHGRLMEESVSKVRFILELANPFIPVSKSIMLFLSKNMFHSDKLIWIIVYNILLLDLPEPLGQAHQNLFCDRDFVPLLWLSSKTRFYPGWSRRPRLTPKIGVFITPSLRPERSTAHLCGWRSPSVRGTYRWAVGVGPLGKFYFSWCDWT